MKITGETTIKELQDYARAICTERGFDDESLEQKFLLLVEEVGELAKALRKVSNIKFAGDTARTEVEDELADVQLLLLNISNKLEVDLAGAVEQKEAKNRKRNWK